MIIVFLMFLGMIGLFALFRELLALSIFGKILNDKTIEEFILKSKFKDKSNKRHIIYFNSSGYISTTPSFLSKYYINDVGQIPYWSKWSKFIDEQFKTLPTTKEYLDSIFIKERAKIETDVVEFRDVLEGELFVTHLDDLKDSDVWYKINNDEAISLFTKPQQTQIFNRVHHVYVVNSK